MVKEPSEEGRAFCARNFKAYNFPSSQTLGKELTDVENRYLPPGYTARRPAPGEFINSHYSGELAFPLAHFHVGLRLPLWPEVRQVLRYFGMIPAQVNPNAISVLVAYACYLREEKVELDLSVFRKVLTLKATNDGTMFLTNVCVKVAETLNKVHHWTDKFILVRGDFSNIPFAPLQKTEAEYRTPRLRGDALCL